MGRDLRADATGRAGTSSVDPVRALVESARVAVAALDPSTLGPDRSAGLIRAIAALGNACVAAQARLAAHAARAQVHRQAGYADAAEWLGMAAGSSARSAARAMALAGSVEALPATAAALASGEVSQAAAEAVATAAMAVDGSEGRLLDLARRKPLRVVQEEARRIRLEAADREQLADQQRRARRFSHWRDELGMVRFSGAVTPVEGVRLLAQLDRRTESRRRQARREGVEDTWEQHAADALVEAVCGQPGAEVASCKPRASRSADVVFVVDLSAYRRRSVEPGEVCHVIDGGPVPLSEVARVVAEHDPFVKAIVHDGIAVQHVVHWGRHVPAEVRTALEIGQPPLFEGKRCACGCGRRYKLQDDHVHPFAAGGPTSLQNLQPRTATEHALKTQSDRVAGLLTRPDGPPRAGDGSSALRRLPAAEPDEPP